MSNKITELTPEQLSTMTRPEIIHYIRQLEMQHDFEKAAISARSKARIEWETYPLDTLTFGHAALFYKAERLAENKNPFCSLFLYEPTLRRNAFALVHIAIKDPEQGKVDRIKSDFIKRILDASATEFKSLAPAESSWKSPLFDPDNLGCVTQLTYPIQIAVRVRYKPNEWRDKNTGKKRQGYKKSYGFALQFEQKVNDYAQDIKVLSWEHLS